MGDGRSGETESTCPAEKRLGGGEAVPGCQESSRLAF